METSLLSKNNISYAGHVVIKRFGFLGFICNNSWDDHDANVSCHALGYAYGMKYDGGASQSKLCFLGTSCWLICNMLQGA